MAEGFEADEELSEIISRLWDIDENKSEQGVDYDIDLQGYVTSTRKLNRDWARHKLFTWVDDNIWERPTYKAFYRLLDNYESDVEAEEELTQKEVRESQHFIDACMETAVMKEAHQWLIDHDKAPEEVMAFKHLLYKIWFRLYRRTREDDELNSCGFEHVFVGETRGRSVIGFHNWIQFYLQEKKGNVDYRGYFRRGTADDEAPRLVTIQFIWKKQQAKPIGSSFLGTSPEFELALYTLCFLADKGDKVNVTVGDYQCEIVCHRHGFGIGSAFPISDI